MERERRHKSAEQSTASEAAGTPEQQKAKEERRCGTRQHEETEEGRSRSRGTSHRRRRANEAVMTGQKSNQRKRGARRCGKMREAQNR